MPARTVAELAAICEGEAEGATELLISGANSLETAGQTELSFVASNKALGLARSSQAGCLLVPKDVAENGKWAQIRVANPRIAFVRAWASLYPQPKAEPGIHPTASIAGSAQISKTASIGAFATIGEQTTVGEESVVG